MKFLKPVLVLTVLLTATGSDSEAQYRKSTIEVDKAKTSAGVEKDNASQQYYELRCAGGAEVSGAPGNEAPNAQRLRFTITQGRRTGINEQMMNMVVDFVAGAMPVDASASNLMPGQCSWLDRGFRPGEPTQIRQEIIYFGQENQVRHGTPVDRSVTAAETHPDSQNVPLYLSYRNHYWSFYVRNTGQGYFEAVNSRYWKPSIPDSRKVRTYSRVNPN